MFTPITETETFPPKMRNKIYLPFFFKEVNFYEKQVKIGYKLDRVLTCIFSHQKFRGRTDWFDGFLRIQPVVLIFLKLGRGNRVQKFVYQFRQSLFGRRRLQLDFFCCKKKKLTLNLFLRHASKNKILACFLSVFDVVF